MRELKSEVEATVEVENETPAPPSIERTIAGLAAVLPLLRRLDADREGTEKEANAKYKN